MTSADEIADSLLRSFDLAGIAALHKLIEEADMLTLEGLHGTLDEEECTRRAMRSTELRRDLKQLILAGQKVFRETQEKEPVLNPQQVWAENWVYFLQREDGMIKIGSSGNVVQRWNQLQRRPSELCLDEYSASNGHGKLTLLRVERGGEKRERELHKRFDAARYRGEFFLPSWRLMHYILVGDDPTL